MEHIKEIWPKWEVLEVIGKGGFGTVYKAKRDNFNDTSYSAIKVVHIPSSQDEVDEMTYSGMSKETIKEYYQQSVTNYVNEIKLMETMKSASNIVSIEDYEVVENKDSIGWTIYIRMELLTNLHKYMYEHKLTRQDIIEMGIQILTALEFTHSQNIIHRDIKPANIFVSKFKQYKLGDFGVSKEVERMSATMSQKGTKSYMAPEMIKLEHYNHTVDLYALGLTMYELLNNGRMPFLPEVFYPRDREEATLKRLSGEEFPDIEGAGELNDIIKKACHYDPTQRYLSATEMKKALNNIRLFNEEVEFIENDEETVIGNSLFNNDETTVMGNDLFENNEETLNVFLDLPLFDDEKTVFEHQPIIKEKRKTKVTMEELRNYTYETPYGTIQLTDYVAKFTWNKKVMNKDDEGVKYGKYQTPFGYLMTVVNSPMLFAEAGFHDLSKDVYNDEIVTPYGKVIVKKGYAYFESNGKRIKPENRMTNKYGQITYVFKTKDQNGEYDVEFIPQVKWNPETPANVIKTRNKALELLNQDIIEEQETNNQQELLNQEKQQILFETPYGILIKENDDIEFMSYDHVTMEVGQVYKTSYGNIKQIDSFMRIFEKETQVKEKKVIFGEPVKLTGILQNVDQNKEEYVTPYGTLVFTKLSLEFIPAKYSNIQLGDKYEIPYGIIEGVKLDPIMSEVTPKFIPSLKYIDLYESEVKGLKKFFKKDKKKSIALDEYDCKHIHFYLSENEIKYKIKYDFDLKENERYETPYGYVIGRKNLLPQKNGYHLKEMIFADHITGIRIIDLSQEVKTINPLYYGQSLKPRQIKEITITNVTQESFKQQLNNVFPLTLCDDAQKKINEACKYVRTLGNPAPGIRETPPKEALIIIEGLAYNANSIFDYHVLIRKDNINVFKKSIDQLYYDHWIEHNRLRKNKSYNGNVIEITYSLHKGLTHKVTSSQKNESLKAFSMSFEGPSFEYGLFASQILWTIKVTGLYFRFKDIDKGICKLPIYELRNCTFSYGHNILGIEYKQERYSVIVSDASNVYFFLQKLKRDVE